ncbi:MAG: hypothetical protein BGO09_02920 [Bacteroidetes bacterium 47-18]|nr:MAG: hypothetical protein BGO09_02920 [Bacteroidetes bacterium 47-18]
MKRKICLLLLLVVLADNSFTQNKVISPLAGWWVNTQYEYFKDEMKADNILYNISPWFLYIDSLGRCTVVPLFEQRTDLGSPVSEKSLDDRLIYHYRKNYDVWLYTIADNDSLLIYSNGITPGAGIIFKRHYDK